MTPIPPGSRCYNCHMPHTTFGLLRAMRSHQVSSPNVRESLDYGRPNACNLCHLDETLSWTADKLHAWYQQPVPELSRGRQDDFGRRAMAGERRRRPARVARLGDGLGAGTENFRARLALSVPDLRPARSLRRGPVRCLEIAADPAGIRGFPFHLYRRRGSARRRGQAGLPEMVERSAPGRIRTSIRKPSSIPRAAFNRMSSVGSGASATTNRSCSRNNVQRGPQIAQIYTDGVSRSD